MRKVKDLGITLFQGADFSFIIGVPGSDGTLINITGYAFEGAVKTSTSLSDSVLATFNFTILDQMTDIGKVKCSMAYATIDDLIASISLAEQFCRLTTPYVYDIVMTDTAGVRSRIIQGPALLSPNVTPAPGQP